MKQIKMTILLIVTSMLLCACPDKEDGHRYITIINQSDKTIVWQPRFFRIGEIYEHFDCQYTLGSIQGNSLFKFNYDDRGITWEAGLKTHYLQIIIMDDKTFEQYVSEPCEVIRENVPVLHIYRLTLSD